MAVNPSLIEIQTAWKNRDPQLVDLCCRLAEDTSYPEKEPSYNLFSYMDEVADWDFQQLSFHEQQQARTQKLEQLIQTPEDQALSDRLRLHEVVLDLWQDNGVYARDCLKQLIARLPFRLGSWKALKSIFKEAEERCDIEIFGALAARLDSSFAKQTKTQEIDFGTIVYLTRRAWRFYRNLGKHSPSFYCQSIVELLSSYSDGVPWKRTWVYNHVFFHESHAYSGRSFGSWGLPKEKLSKRAFPDLWKKEPQPLLQLLETAQVDDVRQYAIDALKKDFSVELRDLPIETIQRLLHLQQTLLDEFCVWLLDNSPQFEKGKFREIGLHDALLSLLFSNSQKARSYVVQYVQTHAKDLALDWVLRLVNHSDKEVRGLASSLLEQRDARKDVGLESWTLLLGTSYGSPLAEKMILKHFSAKELTTDWFFQALLQPSRFSFASQNLFKVHKIEKLGVSFFQEIFEHPDTNAGCASFILSSLSQFPIESLDIDFLKQLLLCEWTRDVLLDWNQKEFLDVASLGADFLFSLAIPSLWSRNDWVRSLQKKQESQANKPFPLYFDHYFSSQLFALLSDASKFPPANIGLERLLDLLQSNDLTCQKYALEYMNKALRPADFAPQEKPVAKEPKKGAKSVSLEGKTFLFTGKLKHMTRAEAQKKVEDAHGQSASSVNKNLNYLVIGDEGSPLLGEGKKSSKQVKAESLQEEGADLKIISELSFLQMLTGHQPQEASSESQESGSLVLWKYLVEEKNQNLQEMAKTYLRYHHPILGKKLLKRPVESDFAIPHSFFTFERISSLLLEKRKELVDLGLEFAFCEASHWKPSFVSILELAEKGSKPVHTFLERSLLADDAEQHKLYRLDPSLLTAENVYRFCESHHEFSRTLGMKIIQTHPKLAEPEALFRLTESADRRMRYFAVETIWKQFRKTGVSSRWKAPEKETKQSLQTAKYAVPATWLSEKMGIQFFLRTLLFEVPPATLSPMEGQLKTISTGKAKISLVDIYCNIACKEAPFAEKVVPLLMEFKRSRGKLESRACAVALARIASKQPQLNIQKDLEWL